MTLDLTLSLVKEKIILTLVKMVRKTLFQTIVRGVRTIKIGETELNSEYNKDNWGFTAKEQVMCEGVGGDGRWKTTKRRHQV